METRILVVDDEQTCRRLLHMLLVEYGSSDDATNGKEALQVLATARANKRPYALLFLDINLPDINGHEVLAHIRQDEDKRGVPTEQRLRVVMVTSHTQREQVAIARDNHCDGFLAKPITPVKIVQQMKKLGFPPQTERRPKMEPRPNASR